MSSFLYCYVLVPILLCPRSYTVMSSFLYCYVLVPILLCPRSYTVMSSFLYCYVLVPILLCSHSYTVLFQLFQSVTLLISTSLYEGATDTGQVAKLFPGNY